MAGERDEVERSGERGVYFDVLHEECIEIAISFTTPRDACCFATISRVFNSVAESNLVWDRFLPSDHRQILARADDGDQAQALLDAPSKKELFMNLADTPILIDGGKMSFWLEKPTGKKCFMIGARGLEILWGDSPTYWLWQPNSEPKSRFAEVARLAFVWWIEIKGKIRTSELSPNTKYAAYLVFQVDRYVWGFYDRPIEVAINTPEGEWVAERVYLDPRCGGILDQDLVAPDDFDVEIEDNLRLPSRRPDGWLEAEIGEFWTSQDGEVQMSMIEMKAGLTKGGLDIEGIEIRPKD